MNDDERMIAIDRLTRSSIDFTPSEAQFIDAVNEWEEGEFTNEMRRRIDRLWELHGHTIGAKP